MFVDILIIAVITLSIMICYHKGVILSLFNMMSVVLSFVLIAVLYEPVVDAFKKSYIGLKLEEIIRSRVAEWFLDAEDNLLHSSETPQFIKDFLYSGTDTATEAISVLSDKILSMAVGVFVFVVLVILIRLIVKYIPGILNSVAKIPLLRQANKILGGVMGILLGIIWSVVLIHVIGLLSLVPEFEFLDKQIFDSVFINFMHTVTNGKLLF